MSYSVLFSLSFFRGSHGKKYENIISEFLLYNKGDKVDALDHEGNWSTAIILDTDYDNGKVRVGYLHWARFYNEWIYEHFIQPPESMVWTNTSIPPLPNTYVEVEYHGINRRGVVCYCSDSSFIKVRLLGGYQSIRIFKDCKFLRPLKMKQQRLDEVLASIV